MLPKVIVYHKMVVKTYPKQHLAKLYSPDLTPSGARSRLNRWINGDRKLRSALRDVGYDEHLADHYFTKREVALLFEYIGDPET